MSRDESYSELVQTKWPWLDKELDIGAPPPVTPEDHEITCRSMEEWEILPNTGGGKLDPTSESQNLDHSKREAILEEDVVGVVHSRSRVWHGQFGVAKVYFHGGIWNSDRPFWELFYDDTEIGPGETY